MPSFRSISLHNSEFRSVCLLEYFEAFLFFFTGQLILICADSNSVAIGNYLSTYYDLESRIAETASFLNDWMDYWCYLAWEFEVPSFADLPDWVQDAAKTVFGNKILFCDPWILLIDEDLYEGKPLPETMLEGHIYKDDNGNFTFLIPFNNGIYTTYQKGYSAQNIPKGDIQLVSAKGTLYLYADSIPESVSETSPET